MRKDYKVYLDDIIESIEKIRGYIEGMSFESFYGDSRTVDAVNRNLGIIGEAANRIPEEIKSKYPDNEWAKIIGLRNIIIHNYSSVDLEIIWDIIQNKLSQLEMQVKEILKD
ncbi:MAG: DUF86 domain-containing protein [Deltaproteobacteria bacterium]|nr:DUF86 domain-containing protein [Deltaproteobacteria bacterium]